MLELARRIRLCMNVGDLLELECAFKRNGVVQTTPDVEHILVKTVLFRKGLDRVDIGQDLGDLCGDLMQLRNQLRRTLCRNRLLDLCHVEREHKEEHELRRICFRRCDRDLGTRPCIDNLIRFARNRRSNYICDGKSLCPAPLRLLERGERITRLPRLRNHNQERVLIDNRVAITELRGDIHLDEDACKLFDVVFTHKTRMVRSTTRNDVDLVERIQIVRIPCEFVKGDGFFIRRDALAHRIAHRLRLLVNLLEHEVLIAALFRCLGVPCHFEHLLRHRCAKMVCHLDRILADNGYFPIRQNIGAARFGYNGRNIRSDEVLALTESDDERVVLLRADEQIGMSAAHKYKRIRAFDALEHRTHCSDEVPRIDLLEEMHDDLCIRLGLEDVPLGNQLFLQRKIVLDDAVVHDGKVAMAVRMRMRVHIRRTPVCRPARMTDAEAAHGHISLDLVAQCGKSADTLLHADVLSIIDGDTCRVIAAILELRQTVEQKLRRLTIPHITNDSTHKNTS